MRLPCRVISTLFLCVGAADLSAQPIEFFQFTRYDLPVRSHSGYHPNAVAFSADGKLLVTAGHKGGREVGQFQVWDFPSLTVRSNFTSFPFKLRSAAVAPDGRRLLIGDNVGGLMVWDGSRALRMGVTPSMLRRNRRWKCHSSLIE